MDSTIKNEVAKQYINNCVSELSIIQDEINENKLSSSNKYLIQYAIIFSSASVEVAIKSIITDVVSMNANDYAKAYLDAAIRNNSMNPSLSKIRALISQVSGEWMKEFDSKLKQHSRKDQITTSLSNIVKNRNSIAHGRSIQATIKNVVDWTNDAIEIVKILEGVVVE